MLKNIMMNAVPVLRAILFIFIAVLAAGIVVVFHTAKGAFNGARDGFRAVSDNMRAAYGPRVIR